MLRTIGFAILLLGALPAQPLFADLVFADNSFNVSDYTADVLAGSPKTDGYELTNVSGELRVRMPLVFSGSQLAIFNDGFFVDPAIFGAVQSIDVSFDAGVLNGNAAVGAILRQDGQYKRAGTIVTTSGDFAVTYTFTPADGLDFSPTGAPIAIGISTSANGATFDVNYRIDNFTATVTAVPEPSSIMLLLISTAIMPWAYRRRTLRTKFSPDISTNNE